MGTVIAITLFILAIVLFMLVRRKIIPEGILETLARIAAVISTLSALAVLVSPYLPTPTPPSPVTITNMSWSPYVEGNGGSLITSLKPVTGTDNAIEVSFNLLADDWVAIYKKLVPRSLSGMRSVRIAYRGTGAPNTIELKLIDKHETIFECVSAGATDTGGQVVFREVPFSECLCRKGSGRCEDEDDVGSLTLNPKDLDRIDFGFSNRPIHGNEPGSGTVVIEKILILP